MTGLRTGVLTRTDGSRARVVAALADVDGHDLVAALELPPPRALVALVGTTEAIEPELEARLRPFLVEGLAGIVVRERLTLLTGATDAGVFSLVGAGLDGATAPRIGVAPLPLVAGATEVGGATSGRDLVPLEPHHSHFVLVDAPEWGDEVPAMLALSSALTLGRRSAVVLVGGGPIARREVTGHVAAGRPALVVAGTGRLADSVASGADGELAGSAGVFVVDVANGPDALNASLRELLGLGAP
jgi:SLOG in TRPM, prokaryote